MNIDTAELRTALAQKYAEDLGAIERFEKLAGLSQSPPPVLTGTSKVLADLHAAELARRASSPVSGPWPPPIHGLHHDVAYRKAPGAKPKPKPATTWPRIPGGSHGVIEACLKLKEPFTDVTLSAATGLTRAGASSQLYRWAKQGLVLKSAKGKFTRSARFLPPSPPKTPSSKPSPPRKAVPELEPAPTPVSRPVESARISLPGDLPEWDTMPVAELREHLERAMKDKAQADMNGQQKLYRILSDKVVMLQTKLTNRTK